MRFEWIITFGDIAWIFTVAFGGLWLASKVLNRLDNIEKWIEDHQRCSDKQEDVLNSISNIVAFVRGQMENRR